MLGGMLGLCFAFVTLRIDSWVSFGANLFMLAGLIGLFAIYAVTVNRIKKRFGINAIFIAALWLPLEYVISHFADLGYLFAVTPDESGLVLRLGSLFGLLMVSFVVVVVNALILISVRRIVRALHSHGRRSLPNYSRVKYSIEELFLERSWYCFPDVRAPPGGAMHRSAYGELRHCSCIA